MPMHMRIYTYIHIYIHNLCCVFYGSKLLVMLNVSCDQLSWQPIQQSFSSMRTSDCLTPNCDGMFDFSESIDFLIVFIQFVFLDVMIL